MDMDMDIYERIDSIDSRNDMVAFINYLYRTRTITRKDVMTAFEYYLEIVLDDGNNNNEQGIFNNDCLIRIIEHPLFDVNYNKYQHKNTPLFEASFYLNYTIVEELIIKGANINYINEEGNNVLMYIIKELNDRIDDLENDEIGLEPQQIIERSKMNDFIKICVLLIKNNIKIDYNRIDAELININKYDITLDSLIKVIESLHKKNKSTKKKSSKKKSSKKKSSKKKSSKK
jgi:hypothetical protein